MDSARRQLRLYFLCGQNRCRSQIAEAYARSLGNEQLFVASAGLNPSSIHPFTVQVLLEDQIDISRSQSKKIDMKVFLASQVIIKLCGDINERCPIVPFGIRNEQWNIHDPLSDDVSTLEAVRATRDEIKAKVIALLHEHDALSAIESNRY
ncbi:arsenate reductase ArsC [Cohnella sp. GCM10020058]|uniref:arsenate reductase ArsC n=1 Tax=Cohnella sp. GCM10020058 TaxID=3317330 RepID=UPI003641A5E2